MFINKNDRSYARLTGPGLLALLAAVSACSPIVSSIDKSQLRNGAAAFRVDSPAVTRTMPYLIEVTDLASNELKTKCLGSQCRLVLSDRENEALFRQFKAHQTFSFEVSGGQAISLSIYFSTSLTADQISRDQLTSSLTQSLKVLPDANIPNQWHVTRDDSQVSAVDNGQAPSARDAKDTKEAQDRLFGEITGRLREIVIEVNAKTPATVSPTNPAPTPSPSPSPSSSGAAH